MNARDCNTNSQYAQEMRVWSTTAVGVCVHVHNTYAPSRRHGCLRKIATSLYISADERMELIETFIRLLILSD